jgi:hypothetical protein
LAYTEFRRLDIALLSEKDVALNSALLGNLLPLAEYGITRAVWVSQFCYALETVFNFPFSGVQGYL